MLIFYPVGMLMDSKGRKWVAVPSLILLSLGMALIPLTTDFASLFLVSLLLGLANGLGSGVNLTLGSDLSPVAGRSQFFGVWRLVSDLGTAGGPLLVAAVTSLVVARRGLDRRRRRGAHRRRCAVADRAGDASGRPRMTP